jgi:hypothetical protein
MYYHLEPKRDQQTRVFLRLIASDPELDHKLSSILCLFATDMPQTKGGYAHHGW